MRSSLHIDGATIASNCEPAQSVRQSLERITVEGGEQNEGEGERFEAGEGGEVGLARTSSCATKSFGAVGSYFGTS